FTRRASQRDRLCRRARERRLVFGVLVAQLQGLSRSQRRALRITRLPVRAVEFESERRQRTNLGVRSLGKLLRRAERQGTARPHLSSRRRPNKTVASRRGDQLRRLEATLWRRSKPR